MKKSTHKYYLGRVIKSGQLNTKEVIESILKPKTIIKKNYAYTFIDAQYNKKDNWIFARLAKYKPQGEVETVELNKYIQQKIQIEGIIDSSSPFVIDLEYMGISYPHVWNSLKKEQFEKYFSEIVEEKYDKLLVKCVIEPIVDLRTFIERVSEFDTIEQMKATVVPPNPLFGPVWAELKEYIDHRNSSELSLNEKAKDSSGIKTKIIELMRKFIIKDDISNDSDINYPITDQAIFMTADGYGHSTIKGKSKGEEIIVKTKDNQKSFLFDKDPIPEELAKKTREFLELINQDRYLRH